MIGTLLAKRALAGAFQALNDHELDAFMRGPFRENPIGVNFDADVLLERFRAGVPVAELLAQVVAPA